jgi:hypothetical protein
MIELEKKYQELLKKYDEGHRRLKYLKKEIANIQKQLQNGKSN